jgi:hypothetical protein
MKKQSLFQFNLRLQQKVRITRKNLLHHLRYSKAIAEAQES